MALGNRNRSSVQREPRTALFDDTLSNVLACCISFQNRGKIQSPCPTVLVNRRVGNRMDKYHGGDRKLFFFFSPDFFFLVFTSWRCYWRHSLTSIALQRESNWQLTSVSTRQTKTFSGGTTRVSSARSVWHQLNTCYRPNAFPLANNKIKVDTNLQVPAEQRA